MEIFLSGLPEQANVSEKIVKGDLKPVMQKLNIRECTYDVDKAPRKRYAFITFLYADDGTRFLESYGPKPGSGRNGTKARLKLLGTVVKCRPSDRTISQEAIRHLKTEVEKDKIKTAEAAAAARAKTAMPDLQRLTYTTAPSVQHPTQPAPATPANAPIKGSISFAVNALHCGHYKFSNEGKLLFSPEYTRRYNGRATARFGKRMMSIVPQIDLQSSDLASRVSIYIPLLSVYEVVWSPNGALALTLTSCPIFVAASAPNFKASHMDRPIRQSSIDSEHEEVVGICLVYHLDLVPDADFYRKIKSLETHATGLAFTRYELTFTREQPILLRDRILRQLFDKATRDNQLPFYLLLQLQSLVLNGYLHPDTVAGMTIQLISLHENAGYGKPVPEGQPPRQNPISPEAMKSLFPAISYPTPEHHDPSEFGVSALVKFLLDSEDEIRNGQSIMHGLNSPASNNSNLTLVYRAVVTPTRITLHGPELENKNRVLRKFPDHQDHFLRVQFSDEDGQNLRFNGRIELTAIFNRFRRIMLQGINIAGRTYSFLGWSHSSLRAHSMWFVAPFVANGSFQSHFSIVDLLGDFSRITSPARSAARIGQAFSETPFAVPIAERGITVSEIPDVRSPDGQRVYSDGVGTISWGAIQVILEYLPPGRRYPVPTCFQVRLAGAKGMLSFDKRLSGLQICLRQSMIKFESNENANLEICDIASQPITLYTNRQLIKIFEDMGAPASWFQGLQDAALKELRLITKTAYNMANFIKVQGVASAIKLHKILLWADRMNLDYRSDSFLRRATDAIVLRELRLLKHKARMVVPNGITLFGVMDETGYLGEHEVYVTFHGASKRSKSKRYRMPPHHGAKLFVTRSPALHPGDIQRATNVIPPDDSPLRALTNCIVFNQYGGKLGQASTNTAMPPRDLPSKLSGGDLDGDIFNVIWDTAICNHKPALTTYEPADYPRIEPINIRRKVEREDIADFFVDFIKTDHLGAIATRHMILADQLKLGTLEPECIRTAELHSTAVDFSKTGIPADLRQLPKAKFRPDFLSPGPIMHIYNKTDIDLEEYKVDDDDEETEEFSAPPNKFYKSDKILGTLYRNVDERQVWAKDIQRQAEDYKGHDLYSVFVEWADMECASVGCFNWQDRRGEANRIRSIYDNAITNTMWGLSEHPTQPLTELEVFIGTIVNKTGAQTLRQRDRSRKLRDEYERISGWITSQIRPKSGGKKKDGADDAATADNAPTERGEDDSDDDSSGDEEEGGAGLRTGMDSTWYQKHLKTLELCLACVHTRADGKKHRKHRNRDGDADIESFWLVAASALIRELEFVRHGLKVDAELASDMQTLGF